MNILSGELDATKTYAVRSWVWVENPDPTGYDGKLTLTLQHGRRAGCKCESDTYAVESIAPDARPGRAFLLCNLTDPNQPDVYETFLADDPRWDVCTCQAGKRVYFAGCKHVDGLRAVVEAGAFDAGAIVPADETSGLWFPSEPEPCGYCSGSGRVRAMKVSEGNPHMRVPDYSRTQDCPYCSGAGVVEDGSKLQAAR